MAEPVTRRGEQEDDAPFGARPPRWTYALFGSRVRISVGMVAWLAVSTVLLFTGPDAAVAWLPLVVVLGVGGSTLVHEGAHALAAHNLGYRVEWVVLGGLAGVTAYIGRDDRPLERAAVALAGPAASAALVLGLVGLRSALTPAATITVLVELAIGLNIVALAVNLLPVGRTDGALLVKGLFQHRRQARRGDGA